MRPVFYYDRDMENLPVVTVCLLRNGEKWARGVAVCGDADRPNKKVGRRIAEHRAKQAINRQSPREFAQSQFGWDFMFTHDADLTEYESQILSKLRPD